MTITKINFTATVYSTRCYSAFSLTNRYWSYLRALKKVITMSAIVHTTFIINILYICIRDAIEKREANMKSTSLI